MCIVLCIPVAVPSGWANDKPGVPCGSGSCECEVRLIPHMQGNTSLSDLSTYLGR